MKYDIPGDQHEVLPNLLGITSAEGIAISEFEGFLKAEIILTENLSPQTIFNCKYILKIHKLALEHLYAFAGKYREVNLSKGGFPFAAARFLPQTMRSFEDEMLLNLQGEYIDKASLVKEIAKVHSELLFIHPFREGNGRTARILANLMCRKAGYEALRFELISGEVFDSYIFAIQKAAMKDYSAMEKLIEFIFPD